MTAEHIEENRYEFEDEMWQNSLELAPAAELLGVTRIACPSPEGNLLAVVLYFRPDESEAIMRQVVVCRPEDGPTFGVCTDTQADWVTFYNPNPNAEEATPQ